MAGRAARSYAGCHHDVEAPIDADNHGVLYLNSRVRLDDIPDGAAYTILARRTPTGRAEPRLGIGNAGDAAEHGNPHQR